LASFPKKYPSVAILKVDIDDWSSPVARQYKLSSIPYFMLYDGNGNLVGRGDEAIEQLSKRLRGR
jgi:hypothetical protein